MICRKEYHGLYYNALQQHPFWKVRSFGKTNQGKGPQFHAWAGYQMLTLEDPLIDVAQAEWTRIHEQYA